MNRLIAVVALVFAPTVHAQGVTGTWNATFDSDISMARDSVVVKARSPATLTLTQRGDSVFGVWKPGSFEGVDVRGTVDGRTLRLTTGRRERTVRIDGETRTMMVRTDLMGVVQGTTIAGTMLLYVGDREPPPRNWEARRK